MSDSGKILAILAASGLAGLALVHADDGQWGQFYRRQEQENFRQSLRSLDYNYRYDPNPRGSSINMEPLRRQLMDWATSMEEARRRRAEQRQNQAMALVAYLRESRRLAEEQARQATLARWNALKQQAANGDVDTSYRVARLIRWGEGRLPREQKTGEDAARPWYQFAAEKGHADAAYELALLVEKTSPTEALRFFTKAADAGKVGAVLPAADLAASGVPGRLPPNPFEAIRLYQLGANANNAAALTMGAYFLLHQPDPTSELRAKAISWLEKAADREPAAAGKLGFLRLHDQPGLPHDYARAVSLAREALKKQPKQPDALLTLGAAKIDGLGGEAKDGPGAVSLLTQAAQAGSMRACHVLAIAHYNGLGGLPRNDSEAVRWRLEGARLGHVESMLELALRYRTGQGVQMSQAESVRWLVAAAEGGSVEAVFELTGRIIAKDPQLNLTMAQLRNLTERAARDGSVKAQELFGTMWLEGFGGEASDKRALEWFRRAAENGGHSGQYYLALHYREGVEVSKDMAEAFRWMRRAAEAGHGDACAQLAWHYATGSGCAQDFTVARDWAKRGAEIGSALGQRYYGWYLGDGLGGPKDGPEAIRQLKLAVEQKDFRATLQLALYLRDGLPGVPADRTAARQHLEAAARSREKDVASQAREALAALDAPKPVSLQGLRIKPSPPKTNTTSIYESLRIK